MAKSLGLKKRNFTLVILCSILLMGLCFYIYQKITGMKKAVEVMGTDRMILTQHLADLREAVHAVERNLWVALNYPAGSTERADLLQSAANNIYIITSFSGKISTKTLLSSSVENIRQIQLLLEKLQVSFNKVHSHLITANLKDINGPRVTLIEEFSPIIQSLTKLVATMGINESQKNAHMAQNFVDLSNASRTELALIASLCVSLLIISSYFLTHRASDRLTNETLKTQNYGQNLLLLSEDVQKKAKNLHRVQQGQVHSLGETSLVTDQLSKETSFFQGALKDLHRESIEVQLLIQNVELQFKDVTQTIMNMVKIQNTTRSFVNSMSEISKKSKVINDIVFETQLLSFRAGVDADQRAEGERNFSYFSKEVQNLATKSLRCADEVSQLVIHAGESALKISSEFKQCLLQCAKSSVGIKEKFTHLNMSNLKMKDSILELQHKMNAQGKNLAYLQQHAGITEHVSKNCDQTMLELISKGHDVAYQGQLLSKQLLTLVNLVDDTTSDAKISLAEGASQNAQVVANLNCA